MKYEQHLLAGAIRTSKKVVMSLVDRLMVSSSLVVISCLSVVMMKGLALPTEGYIFLTRWDTLHPQIEYWEFISSYFYFFLSLRVPLITATVWKAIWKVVEHCSL